ncbi:MAG: aldehyde ferredoxin oxidoreductase family protein, partial [Deltaproteobacteria bacterium]|nr:aldehyde ferredoxin oxidoreductase family protein [Deltaproteobacteria bacterium]
IDLTTGDMRTSSIPVNMRRLFIGGRGLNAYLLYNHLQPGTDPLAPGNPLLIGAGLLSGGPAPGGGRTDIASKSPITGLMGDSNMGGFFSPELRFAGFDHLVIKGRAEKPVYLWIRDGRIEIRDANDLWGKDTFETPELIRQELGDDEIKVICIGLAGENLVRFANVRTGPKNAGGRTGMGCVMGSKNLKAVAVRGTLDLEVKFPEKALDYYRELQGRILGSKAAYLFGLEGTMMQYNPTNTTGILRVKNFGLNRMDDLSLTPDTFLKKYSLGSTACYGCAVHCRHKWMINEGPKKGLRGEGPEYYTLMALGNIVYNRSWETILEAQHIVDKYGLDLAEAGNIIGWLMDLYNRGIIDRQDTDELDLAWENSSKVLPLLLEKIVRKEGVGGVLADGLLPAVERMGRGGDKYALHVKGLGMVGTDDRSVPSLALGVAVSTRGADHLRSRPATDLYGLPEEFAEKLYGFRVSSDYNAYETKAKLIHYMELLYELVDSLGTCKFQTLFISPTMPKYEEYSELLYYLTGIEMPPGELMESAERCYTLERLFNIREGGITRKDDYLPDPYYSEPTQSGMSKTRGKFLDREAFDRMLDEYYEEHGWDSNGVPRKETLKRLQLDGEPSHTL